MSTANDFVAIDFETANEKRSSPCALSIAVSKNGEIIQTNHWLIKPHKDFSWFNPFNTSIHGIDYQDVEKAPEFIEIWPDIVGFLQGQTVIAHNAPFDLSVLRHTMDRNIDINDTGGSLSKTAGSWGRSGYRGYSANQLPGNGGTGFLPVLGRQKEL